MFGLGMQELMIILVIVLVLCGSTRLPEIGKGMGQAIRNFKKATDPREIEAEFKKNTEEKESESA